MNAYKYSPTINMFYLKALQENHESAGTWPDDVIDVDDSVYLEFAANNQPDGKVRISNESGFPAWGDIQKQELPEQLLQATHRTTSQLSIEAFALQCAVDAGTASAEQVETLKALKKTIAQRIGENNEG